MKNIVSPNSRLSKSLVNVATGVVLQILTLALSFVVRIVFVRRIGYDYLGVSSLFTNILTVLSVADLGFGTSISISLYAALKKADEDHIAGIISYYKKVYLIIGGIIFTVGCAICPFVGHIVNTSTPVPFLELYFFIYLVNLVSTYFISYRHAIIKADQKNGVLNVIHSLVLLAKSIVELLILTIFPFFAEPQYVYISYLVVMVLATYAGEIISARLAKKMYPFAFVKREIPKEEKKEISKNVRSLLLYKVCKAVNVSIDSILISIMVSTTILGKYNNYVLIINVLMGFGALISRNSIASLGNFVLTESKERQIKMFNTINFIHIVITAFFVVNYVGILNPFFHLAFGLDSTLSVVTLAFSAIHLAFNMNYQVNELFRETTKMFRKIPYISAINLALNIGLSILLGHFYGLEGILAGTLIAYFCTSFWFETFALFKFYFKSSSKNVWIKLGYAILSISACSVAAYFISTKVVLNSQVAQLVLSAFISVVLSIICIFSFVWFEEFKPVFLTAKRILISIYKKINGFLTKEKVQIATLIISIVAIVCLTVVRDLLTIEIDKYIFVALCFVFASLLKKEYFLGFVFFLIPFHSGMSTRIIYPMLTIIFLLKNLKMFKNWRLLINYLLIPTLIAILEIIMSTVYGGTTSFDVVLLIWAILVIFSFIVYDKKETSRLPIKLFVAGAAIVGLIMAANWIKIAWYTSSKSTVPGMSFTDILSKNRFGDVQGLIEWCEFWGQITYPFKTSMKLGDNENYVGLLMLVGLMTSAFLLFKKEKLYIKLLICLAALVFAVLGVYTASKSFFICFAIFIFVFFLSLYAENRLKLWVVGLILGSITAATLIVCFKVPFVNKYLVDRLNNDSGRFTLIGQYFGEIFRRPLVALFGTGSSMTQTLFSIKEPPHNSIVQIVGGYGLFGFGVIIAGTILTFGKARKRVSIIKDDILGSLAPLFVYVIFTMTSQIFLPPTTLVFGLPAMYIFISKCNYISTTGALNMNFRKDNKLEVKRSKKQNTSDGKKLEGKVLVTGAAGFIGSFLVKKLLETTNYTIVGIDNMNDYYDVSLKKARIRQIKKNKKFIFIKDDISDREAIEKLFKRYKFDIVVNLAAQAGVRYSIDHPDTYIKSNIIGMYYILEACRYNPVKHLVYASSSSVYGGNTKVPFSTKDKVDNPVSLYAATKKSDELLAHAYSKLYNIPTTGLRFFTVYGPMGRPDMAYFSFTNKLIKGEQIDIFNYGNCKRDFTYVDDIVDGVIKVMENPPKKKEGEDGLPIPPYKVYNIGNSNPENLMDFVNTLADSLKNAKVLPDNFDVEQYIRLVPMQKGDVEVTYADTSDLEKDFGYKPSTPLSEGLKRFAEWYKDYYKK